MEEMENTANKIIKALSGRKGFDGWWGTIDSDIQDEIKDEIQGIIDKNSKT